MTFDYESSIWGRGTATLAPGDPTSIRLRASLKALEDLQKGDKVLEVGCGAGQFIRSIKGFRQELECYGSDISKKALDIAKQSSDGVLYLEQNDEKLPYADKFFSSIVIFDVLEHVYDPAELLKEVNRVLKPGGILYAFVPCEDDILSIWRLFRFFNIGAGLTKKFAGHIQFFSRRSLFSLIKKAGFKINKISYSEHVIGQLLGLAAFFSMSFAVKKEQTKPLNNEIYFTENIKSDRLRWFRKLVNSVVYFESVILQRFPSSNAHLVARKL